MNTLTKYIALAASMFLVTSCVDLDQLPTSFPTEEGVYSGITYEMLEKNVSGLYYDFWNDRMGFSCRIQVMGMGADEIMYSPTKPNNRLSYIVELTPSIDIHDKDVSVLWNLFYKTIYDANSIFENIVIPENEKAKYESLLGEVYFMRGLSYFYLVRLFGDVPIILKNSDATITMPRSKVAEVYEQVIVKDMQEAIRLLPEKSRSGYSFTPSKSAAKACMADIYMTMAGWPLKKTELYTEAAKLCKEIIDHAAENKLKLTEKYSDLWLESKKKDSNEHMFGLHHDASLKIDGYFGKAYVPKDYYPNAGWADFYANEEFYLKYPDDDRKKHNFLTKWKVKRGEGGVEVDYTETADKLPGIKKFYDYTYKDLGKNAGSNGLTCIYRYADVLLMYAEASTRANNSVDELARKCLKDIQDRANMKDEDKTNTTDPETFLKAVFDENGWEFFGEMRRWFDLVRLEKLSEVVDSELWNNSVYKTNEHYYMFIPQSQINLSGWENNKGY